MDDFLMALAACKLKSARENRIFIDGYHRDVAGWKLQPDDEEFLHLITTGRISDRALLSNTRVRRAAQNALVEVLPREYEKRPQRQWLFITLACDIGRTWERAPLIDTVALRNTFKLHLIRCGLEGFGVLETDIWKNLAGEPGRRVVPHLHFVGYPADGEPIDVKELERELCEKRALKNALGARPADVKEIGGTPADFARVGRYMFKPPAYAKNPVPRLDGTYDLVDVKHSRGSVARLVEILSRMEVGDVIFSIGGGKPMAAAVRKAVAKEVRHRPGRKSAPSREQVIQHWRRMRLVNGSPKFKECVVITRKDQRTDLDG